MSDSTMSRRDVVGGTAAAAAAAAATAALASGIAAEAGAAPADAGLADTPPTSFSLDRDSAPAYWHVDILWLMLATGRQTGGSFSLMEELCPKGSGPPPHAHEQDEAFYVIDGEVSFAAGGRVTVVKAGGFIAIPRGTVHGFRVDSETARVLNLYAPAGFEEVVATAGTPAAKRTLPPRDLPVNADPDRVRAVLKRVGMRPADVPDVLRPSGTGDARMRPGQ